MHDYSITYENKCKTHYTFAHENINLIQFTSTHDSMFTLLSTWSWKELIVTD